MPTIRTAHPSDAAEITALTVQLGYTTENDSTHDRLERLLKRPDQLVLVACVEGRLTGWLQAHAYDILESGFIVEIVGLVVAQDNRRSGSGRALVQQAEHWASGLGAETLVVRSNVLRTESHRFYPALGFIASKTQAVYEKPLSRRASA